MTEMLALIESFEGHDLFFVTYQSPRASELAAHYRLYTMDNIGTNPIRLLWSLPTVWQVLRNERPDALVSTGSEIAIPFFVLARIQGIRTVFVESCCRIHSPSRTGKAVYPLADVFLVQWPQLLPRYGRKARYQGGLL
jgi:UDP-N-acetylglucosamine:LPS N-acetylglucosamine transferase